ncbi:hypothetical protein B0H11DRAFT_1914987 [Mycena galericulata]|nr:hypothetical protein B0H11DRAFT_1914987 [Mycena galericulata]
MPVSVPGSAILPVNRSYTLSFTRPSGGERKTMDSSMWSQNIEHKGGTQVNRSDGLTMAQVVSVRRGSVSRARDDDRNRYLSAFSFIRTLAAQVILNKSRRRKGGLTTREREDDERNAIGIGLTVLRVVTDEVFSGNCGSAGSFSYLLSSFLYVQGPVSQALRWTCVNDWNFGLSICPATMATRVGTPLMSIGSKCFAGRDPYAMESKGSKRAEL